MPRMRIELPTAGMNLTGYSYWGTALPFVDVAHMDGKWEAVAPNRTRSRQQQVQDIPVNGNDYPASLPEGAIARSLIFTHNGGIYPTGVYALEWQGNGDVRMVSPGLAIVDRKSGQIRYRVSSTNQLGIMLDITRTDAANPVRNISVLAPFPTANGEIFNPKYKHDLASYGVIRCMDWNKTNNSRVSKWSERTEPNDFFWGGSSGVPYELQIQLSNELNEDLWITIPHMADDDYVRNLAHLVNQKLSPGLRVWVEYSNEVWNGGFRQFRYAYNVLRPKYGVPNAAQAYGRRAAEIFDIFSGEITDPHRLVRVIAGQNANNWILREALTGATVDGKLKADVAAVAPYFGLDTNKLYQQHLDGKVNLDDVFAELRFNIDSAISSSEKNREVGATFGIPLVTYEGGQHLVARPGVQQNDKTFVDLLISINRDKRMGGLYTHLLDKWYGMGGKTFVFFDDIGRGSKFGSWGLKETYLDDDAVKFRAVQDYLERRRQTPADSKTGTP